MWTLILYETDKKYWTFIVKYSKGAAIIQTNLYKLSVFYVSFYWRKKLHLGPSIQHFPVLKLSLKELCIWIKYKLLVIVLTKI